MLHSRQGLRAEVATILKPASSLRGVEEARQFAMPIVALGTIIAILYFGRVFFITAMTP